MQILVTIQRLLYNMLCLIDNRDYNFCCFYFSGNRFIHYFCRRQQDGWFSLQNQVFKEYKDRMSFKI